MIEKKNKYQKTPFFIVGCGRSGTTLLRMFLTVHGNIAIPPEANFTERAGSHFAQNGQLDSVGIDEFLQVVEDGNRFKSLELPMDYLKDYLESNVASNLKECLECVYFAYAERIGKRRWGDKNPYYVLKLDLIHKIFSNAKIIHMIRDGRDVAISYRKRDVRPYNLYLSAKRWEQCIRKGQEWGKKHAELYLEVYYENLISHPERELRRICEFIDEEFVPEMLDSYQKNRNLELIPSYEQGHHGNLSKPIMRTNKEKWGKEMNKTDISIFQKIAGSTLEKLGYPIVPMRMAIWLRLYFLMCEFRYHIGQNKKLQNFADNAPWRLRHHIKRALLIDRKHYR